MEMKQQQELEPPSSLPPEVVKALASGKADERAKAEAEIHKLGAAKLEALLALAREEAEKRRKRRRNAYWVMAGYVLFLIVLVALGAGGAVGSIGGLTSGIGAMFAASQLQKNTVPLLAEEDDIRIIGPMVDALGYNDKDVPGIAEQALIRLLPKMQASDSILLNEEQRNALYKRLHGDPADLQIAILKALEQVGDSKALPHVQRLAREQASWARARRVKEAAEACLPFLLKRVEQERAAGTLLRATTADETSNALLRPAGGGHTDTETLLRPGEAGEPQDV
jgi:hypothetical protein